MDIRPFMKILFSIRGSTPFSSLRWGTGRTDALVLFCLVWTKSFPDISSIALGEYRYMIWCRLCHITWFCIFISLVAHSLWWLRWGRFWLILSSSYCILYVYIRYSTVVGRNPAPPEIYKALNQWRDKLPTNWLYSRMISSIKTVVLVSSYLGVSQK